MVGPKRPMHWSGRAETVGAVLLIPPSRLAHRPTEASVACRSRATRAASTDAREAAQPVLPYLEAEPWGSFRGSAGVHAIRQCREDLNRKGR
jgi:hypothetical protein